MKRIFTKLKKGFTLVELVVVIAIIAILAGVVTGTYFGITDSANKSATRQTAEQFKTLLLAEVADNTIAATDSSSYYVEYNKGEGIIFTAAPNIGDVAASLQKLADDNDLGVFIKAENISYSADGVLTLVQVETTKYYGVIDCTKMETRVEKESQVSNPQTSSSTFVPPIEVSPASSSSSL